MASGEGFGMARNTRGERGQHGRLRTERHGVRPKEELPQAGAAAAGRWRGAPARQARVAAPRGSRCRHGSAAYSELRSGRASRAPRAGAPGRRPSSGEGAAGGARRAATGAPRTASFGRAGRAERRGRERPDAGPAAARAPRAGAPGRRPSSGEDAAGRSLCESRQGEQRGGDRQIPRFARDDKRGGVLGRQTGRGMTSGERARGRAARPGHRVGSRFGSARL